MALSRGRFPFATQAWYAERSVLCTSGKVINWTILYVSARNGLHWPALRKRCPSKKSVLISAFTRDPPEVCPPVAPHVLKWTHNLSAYAYVSCPRRGHNVLVADLSGLC